MTRARRAFVGKQGGLARRFSADLYLDYRFSPIPMGESQELDL